MKTCRSGILKTIIFIFLCSVSAVSLPQSGYGKTVPSADFNEGLSISTDRDIYIAGEQVWMKLYKVNRFSRTFSALSKILYVELLNDANNPVVQLKIFAEGNSGAGGFTLPDTLTSGNYLIRAYSKWMLNFPETGFAYKTISVLNPFKNLDRLIDPSRRKNEIKPSGNRALNAKEEVAVTDNNKVRAVMNFDRQEYSSRQKIGIDIALPDSLGRNEQADLSLAVIKSVLSDASESQVFEKSLNSRSATSVQGDSIWLPEPEGELISGSIRNKRTNEPLVESDIMFAVAGNSAVCQFGKTNTRGEFMFIVRGLYGPKEIVIQPFLHNDDGCYVELNQPYCSTFSDTAPGMFYLDSARAVQINNAVITMQIDNLYRPFRQKHQTDRKSVDIRNFYGQPSRRVFLSDYIELTNVREIVKEILPEVRVFRKYDKTWLKVFSDNLFQKFENQALVLVDGVPVYDIETLLDMPCKDLERIDIINVRYFYADYIFDGIVSFFTKKGNLGDLKFDESVFRQIYEGCQEPEKFYSPQYAVDSLKNNRIPDFRNTLYWNPSLLPDKDGKLRAEFYASDEPGEYSAIIEGLTSTGRRVYSVGRFRIH